MIVKVTCYKCGKVNELADRVGFRAECESCGEDLRICLNCKFYDKTAYNECREPSAEVVREKSRSNRCDYFQPAAGSAVVVSEKDKIMSAAEALFKKK